MNKENSNNFWVNDISAKYKIKRSYNAKLEIEDIAQKMADGISIGTTQVAEGIYTPKTSATHIKTSGFIPGRLRADVENLKVSDDKESAEMTVKFSSEIMSDVGGFPMLMAALVGDQYGTAYEIDEGKLIDLNLPPEYLKQYKGPKFGVDGLRKLYGTEKNNQPHAAILLKPNTGQPEDHFSYIAEMATRGGVNYVKDDEMKVNTPGMIQAVSNAIEKAKDKSGQNVIYGPNVTADYKNAKKQALMAIENGASAIMVNIVHAGLEYVRMLSEDPDINVPIHIHRTGHDAITRGKFGMNLKVFTQLWRLAGADQIHIGPVFGGLYKPDYVKDIFDETQKELGSAKKSLPVISRGNLNIIPGTLNFLKSKNLLFLCDDGVYKHPEGVEVGIREVSNKLKNIEFTTMSDQDQKDIDHNNQNVLFE